MDLDGLLKPCKGLITISRKPYETFDEVKKRAVYKFVEPISKPIIAYDEWIGDCMVEDLYKESDSKHFIDNLNLQDPNILIFYPTRYSSNESSTIKLFSYIFNILRKYSKGGIDYKKRLCRTILSPFITLETVSVDFSFRMETDVKLAPVLTLMRYCNQYDINKLTEMLLTETGINKRKEELEQIRKEKIEQMEGDNNWGADDEMTYIRENGGDWIWD